MSAPIRFTDLRYHENEMVVYLNRGILPYFLDDRGKWKLSGYYRIHFLTDEWTERKRELFRNELLEAVRRQKEYYRGDRKREVFVFFLGEQQADDLASFLVDKYQLACFIDLHRITDNGVVRDIYECVYTNPTAQGIVVEIASLPITLRIAYE